MENREELHKVTVVMPSGEMREGLVVGCDYNVGITLVNAKDTKEYLLCGSGPLSQQHRKYPGCECMGNLSVDVR